jgi:5'-3' exoribonuclease 2
MGVPTFFLSIIRNKFYKNVHSGVSSNNVDCDYFFLDYNGIVYAAYEKIKKNIEGKNLSKNSVEEIIIEEVIRYTKYLICDVVKPNKLTYIALDGPAPRGKMVQQRSRRYKGYYDKIYVEKEREKMGLEKKESEWDRSANISPGTEFMEKLSNKLIAIMKNKGFSTHCENMEVILSNSNVPGEGEHKFLPLIRSMRMKKSSENAKIYLYGSDADLIVLAVSTHKNNIHIIRETHSLITIPDLKKMYESYEFIQINIDNLRNSFNHDLTRVFKDHSFDKIRILNDYIFLTFLVGNDFVLSLHFLKIKKDGLKILIAIYHEIKLKHNGYLINYHPDKDDVPQINLEFFKELLMEIGKKEDILMKEQQIEINKYMKGFRSDQDKEREHMMTPFEIFQARYSHLYVFSKDHPLYSKYFNDFQKIDYSKSYEMWKEEYYKYYFNIDKSNLEEYNNVINRLVENYLESLLFTLKYYFQGCPSWNWHYKYRVPPLLSDVYNLLENSKININDINFELGTPYTPFQQLMLILPPQMNILVPKVLQPIMTDDKLLCTQFYPTDFRLDVTFGMKTIYSEALLPEIDEEFLIPIIKKYEEKLTDAEKERNTIKSKPVKVAK